jgi:hypothetical protein
MNLISCHDAIGIQHESKRFISPIRAQLNTSAFKPCSYFARQVADAKAVFVKGPYEHVVQASVQLYVQRFKRMILPSLASISCEMIHLGLDKDFLPCQFGYRALEKVRPSHSPFLVFEDLLQPKVDGPLPTKQVTSKKWASPVDVVDFEDSCIASVFQHVWYSKEEKESIYVKRPDLALQYVLHILLSWICGCGADLANRNFIICEDKVYQVDLEAWCKFEWRITDTAPGSTRTQANRQLLSFIETHWDELKPHVQEAHTNLKEKGMDLFNEQGWNVNNLVIMKARLDEIQTLEGFMYVVTQERDEKQKRQKH